MAATARRKPKATKPLTITDDEAAALIRAAQRSAYSCKVDAVGVGPVIDTLRKHGASFRFITKYLNERGVDVTANTVLRHAQQECRCHTK
jgi:hypothetical protein